MLRAFNWNLTFSALQGVRLAGHSGNKVGCGCLWLLTLVSIEDVLPGQKPISSDRDPYSEVQALQFLLLKVAVKCCHFQLTHQVSRDKYHLYQFATSIYFPWLHSYFPKLDTNGKMQCAFLEIPWDNSGPSILKVKELTCPRAVAERRNDSATASISSRYDSLSVSENPTGLFFDLFVDCWRVNICC